MIVICEFNFLLVPFFRQDALKQHARKHLSGDEKHDCKLCRRVFSSEISMQQHMSRRHSLAEHECKSCNQVFYDAVDLKSHIDKCHPITSSQEILSFSEMTKDGSEQELPGDGCSLAEDVLDETATESSFVADALCELASGRGTASESIKVLTIVKPSAAATGVESSSVNSVAAKQVLVDQTVILDTHMPDDAVGRLSFVDENAQVVTEKESSSQTIAEDHPMLDDPCHKSVEIKSEVHEVDGNDYVLSADGLYLMHKQLFQQRTDNKPSATAAESQAISNLPYIYLGTAAQSALQALSSIDDVETQNADSDAFAGRDDPASASSSGLVATVIADHQYSTETGQTQFGSGQQVSYLAPQNTVDSKVPMETDEGLESTMQSILSGMAHLESVVPVPIKLGSKKRTSATGTKKVEVKQEPADHNAPVIPIVPLRTRSGRERKIKVKYSA